MIYLQQHIYTSVAMFRTVAQSKDLPADIRKQLEKRATYPVPSGYSRYTVAEPSSFPVVHRFFPLEESGSAESSHYAISQTIYVGKDLTGRVGNYLTHSVVVDKENLEKIRWNVGQLIAHIRFRDRYIPLNKNNEKDREKLDSFGNEILPPLQVEFPVEEEDWQPLEKLTTKLNSKGVSYIYEKFLDAFGKDHPFFIISDTTECLEDICGILLTLPISYRQLTSFSTNESSPDIKGYNLVMFTPGTQVPSWQIGKQFELVELTALQKESFSISHPRAQFLEKCLRTGEIDVWRKSFIYIDSELSPSPDSEELKIAQEYWSVICNGWIVTDVTKFYEAAKKLRQWEKKHIYSLLTKDINDFFRENEGPVEPLDETVKLYCLWSQFLTEHITPAIQEHYINFSDKLFDKVVSQLPEKIVDIANSVTKVIQDIPQGEEIFQQMLNNHFSNGWFRSFVYLLINDPFKWWGVGKIHSISRVKKLPPEEFRILVRGIWKLYLKRYSPNLLESLTALSTLFLGLYQEGDLNQKHILLEEAIFTVPDDWRDIHKQRKLIQTLMNRRKEQFWELDIQAELLKSFDIPQPGKKGLTVDLPEFDAYFSNLSISTRERFYRGVINLIKISGLRIAQLPLLWSYLQLDEEAGDELFTYMVKFTATQSSWSDIMLTEIAKGAGRNNICHSENILVEIAVAAGNSPYRIKQIFGRLLSSCFRKMEKDEIRSFGHKVQERLRMSREVEKVWDTELFKIIGTRSKLFWESKKWWML